jgi:hemerythrin-like domain-containing protein
MKITDRLKVEHGVFLQQLKVLERLVGEGASREALLAVTETIVAAEQHHSRIEDRVLYPALVKVLGPQFPLLVEIRAQHDAVRQLTDDVRRGGGERALVRRYVEALRHHMESEIHSLFVLAEEYMDEDDLESMCSWDEEHVYAEAGRGQVWADRWLS